MGFGYWTEKHIEAQRKLNLRAAIEKAAGDAGEAEGRARPDGAASCATRWWRSTTRYYAPPGAQILYTNPLFVRSHDFLGMQGTAHTWRATEVFGIGLAVERRRPAGRFARQRCRTRWPKPNRTS